MPESSLLFVSVLSDKLIMISARFFSKSLPLAEFLQKDRKY